MEIEYSWQWNILPGNHLLYYYEAASQHECLVSVVLNLGAVLLCALCGGLGESPGWWLCVCHVTLFQG